ncbi:MAG TPA: TAXI family TRAP transporter solute-binding subunit [Vicinamibacteria bacterium]|nr:TAXI family TRAP transporter solute-binding subunit [Vicinamibacteria bacterium]
MLRALWPLALLRLAHPLAATEAQTLSIATGNPSGLYYPLGGGLASVWSKHVPGVNIKAEVTAGSVTNLIQVAKLESDIGLAQGDSVADAVRGANAFPKPLPLAVLAKMYPNVVHLVTVEGSGVDSVSDLLGKKVSVGPPGSGNAVTAWNILDAVGIGEDEFVVRQLNYAETANGLKDGVIDAGFIAGGVGIAAIVELAAARDIALVPFTDEEMATISARIPAYSSFSVPRGVYRGVNEPVQTPTLWNFLVVHQSMDEETAYRLVRAIFDHRSVLESISQVARFIVPETAADVGDLPLHPGARRYYDEVLHDRVRGR